MSKIRISDPKRRVSLLDKGDGIYALVMADRENKNAFTGPFVSELEEVLDFVCRDRTVKVLVLTGLPEVFAARAPRSGRSTTHRHSVVQGNAGRASSNDCSNGRSCDGRRPRAGLVR